MDDLPLGRRAAAPTTYDRSVLRGIERAPARRAIGIGEPLPFLGTDVWRGYELSWLMPSGLPRAGILSMHVPCDSPAMVESKSLKLYLNAFAQTVFESRADVAATIRADVSQRLGADVEATVLSASELGTATDYGNYCLDELAVTIERYQPDPGLLAAKAEQGADAVHTHLFRTLCPVTGQPDWGSIAISWRGRLLDRRRLLTYLVSFREEASFHENVTERIFVDVARATVATELTVDARFLRRGGVDINPFRSTRHATAPAIRLYRQ